MADLRLPGILKATRVSILAICLLVPAACFTGSSGDQHLEWLTFDRGIAKAKQTNRKVLIDVYTDWCGWCKRMEADTYSDKGVAAYLKAHYVLVRLNAESDAGLTYEGKSYTERTFAEYFGVNGYPTTLFLKPDGQPITRYPGYADAKRFGKVLSFIGEDYYQKVKFDDYLAAP